MKSDLTPSHVPFSNLRHEAKFYQVRSGKRTTVSRWLDRVWPR